MPVPSLKEEEKPAGAEGRCGDRWEGGRGSPSLAGSARLAWELVTMQSPSPPQAA